MKDMYSSLLPNLAANKEGDLLAKTDPPPPLPDRGHRDPDSLGEVGQVLRDLGDERERARRAVVGVLLHQVEERGRHDGGAEEAQEQGGADQALADIQVAPVAAFLPPGREDLLQLSWEDAVEEKHPG